MGGRAIALENRGQSVIIAVVLLTVILALAGACLSYIGSVRRASDLSSARSTAREAAMAGVEKAVWCLNQPIGANCGGTNGLGFAGETSVSIGHSAFYTTIVDSASGTIMTVTSKGYYPSLSEPTSTVTLKADIGSEIVDSNFHYGIKAGTTREIH